MVVTSNGRLVGGINLIFSKGQKCQRYYMYIFLTKRLIDGEVGLDHEHGCTNDLVLLKDVASSSGQDTIDTTNGQFRTLEEKVMSILG